MSSSSIFGMALFTLASLACALAWSLPSLVVARLFQGIGASAVMGINSAMLKVIYPARLLGRGYGRHQCAGVGGGVCHRPHRRLADTNSGAVPATRQK